METEQAQQPREENGGPVLEIRDLTKRFGATLALNSVSLTLGRNEVLALLGDNGAGSRTRTWPARLTSL
jgi:ABC-type sugar transport system ATPase subunit